MDGEVTIRLTNRAILLVLALLAFVWVLARATNIVVVLFLAILLAAAVSSAANRLARYRIGRSTAIALSYLMVIAVLAGLVALIIPLVSNEVGLLRDNLPTYQAQVDNLLARFPSTNGQRLSVDDLTAQLSGRLEGVAVELSKSAVEVGSTLVTVLLIFVFAYFLAADARFAERVVTRFFPPSMRERALRLMGTMGDSLGSWVRAQLLLALFFGVAFGIGLAIMRMPYALTLAVIGGVLEIIPYVGGFLTIALAVLIGASTGKLWLVIAALIWYAIVVNVEAHVVAPKMVGEIVGLHPLVIVLALFLGAEVLGILGALLAVPIAVIIQILLDEFWTFGEPPAAGERQLATPAQPGTIRRRVRGSTPAQGD